MKRSVTSSAPARIDFGGGTLDIFPLYLYFDGNITINAAISMGAHVRLDARDDDRIIVHSLDTGASLECDGGVANLPVDGALALITRVLRYLKPAGGLEVKTRLLPPVGSGLGASSTLFIALSHAVLAYMDQPRDPQRIIRLSNNLETQLMGMPAGTQDYYPPTYGGINAVHYEIEDVWVEPLDTDGTFIQELQQYAVLTYTNMTHHSGTTNWSKIRNYFDRVPQTVECLKRASDTAFQFYDAFKARDLRAIAALLNAEWENRKGFSDSVSNPDIERMMAAARDAGAWANKLCGAGGGGCMLTIVPPAQRQAVVRALEDAGCTYLDAQIVREGVQVDVTP